MEVIQDLIGFQPNKGAVEQKLPLGAVIGIVNRVVAVQPADHILKRSDLRLEAAVVAA